jgi:predicted nucleic acid-binding protein
MRQRRGVDTNVLIYAHIPESPHHEVVRRYLSNQLAQEEVTLVVTPGILHELVHVVTDGRRFEPPVAMKDALAVARTYLNRTNVECLSVDQSSLLRAFELLERYQLGRKRIADTLFAASLLDQDIRELITCNLDDFRVFEELTLIDPRIEGQ